jgi:hypothetical protein
MVGGFVCWLGHYVVFTEEGMVLNNNFWWSTLVSFRNNLFSATKHMAGVIKNIPGSNCDWEGLEYAFEGLFA